MSDQQQLAWERDNAKWAGPGAIVAGVLILAGFVIPIAFAGGNSSNERESLIRIHEHEGAFLTSAVVQGLAYFVLAAVFVYLLKAIGARRPEAVNFLRPVVFAAPVVLLAGLVITQIGISNVADTFVSSGPQTVHRAKDLVKDRSQVGNIVVTLGTLLLALSFVLICVNGMRAGLFSRFVGFVGFIAGALLVLPIVPGAIFQAFWAGAVGILILDRWPQDRGPAWGTVEAIPWPSAAGAAREPEPPPAEETPGPEPEERPVNPRAGRKKKKRKRR